MVKTTIVLWRIGKLNYFLIKGDPIAEFESIEKFDREYIRKIAEDKLGFKLFDNDDEKQKQFEDLNNSFIDESRIVEIRYHER